MSIPPSDPPTQPQTRCIAQATWDQLASGKLPQKQLPVTSGQCAVKPSPLATDHDALATATWQRAVVRAAEEASADVRIPTATDRLQAAIDLALTGAVTLHADGLAEVKNGSHRYTIEDECTCADSQNRSRWCKHYLSLYLHKQALAIVAGKSNTDQIKETVMETNDVTFPDDDEIQRIMEEQERRPWPLAPQNAPELPEAPYSANVKAYKNGFSVQLTVRKSRNQEFLQAVEGLIEWLPRHGYTPTPGVQPAAATAASAAPEPAADATEGWCSKHALQMQQGAGGDWFHKTGERPDGKGIWCRGK